MSHKDNEHYNTSKIIVDYYHPTTNQSFVCSCYTPGVPTSIEKECLVKTVTYEEIKSLVADKFGMVNVSFFPDDPCLVPFEQYLKGLDEFAITTYCTDVINRREFRNHLFNPSLYLGDVSRAWQQQYQPSFFNH